MDIRELSQATAEKFKSNPELIMLEALANAFALIATSDGRVAESETKRFMEVIKGVDDLRHVPMDRVESAFSAAVDAIRNNLEDGTENAINAVAAAKGNAENIELILSASQATIVADLQLKDSEEAILRRICEALGEDPDAY